MKFKQHMGKVLKAWDSDVIPIVRLDLNPSAGAMIVHQCSVRKGVACSDGSVVRNPQKKMNWKITSQKMEWITG